MTAPLAREPDRVEGPGGVGPVGRLPESEGPAEAGGLEGAGPHGDEE